VTGEAVKRASLASVLCKVAGMTHWNPDAPEPRHEIAVDVVPERFFVSFLGMTSFPPLIAAW
jgi:hypothetical protein